jgi:hypothetical protein
MPKVMNTASALELDRSRPKMVVTLGRGGNGKSIFLRWVAETSKGIRPLKIVDADPNNRTLDAHFSDVLVPPAIDGEDKRVWLEDRFNDLIESASDDAKQHDMVLDVGANDLLLRRLGREVQLAEALEEGGVDPVAVHMLGAEEDDLRYLEDVENGNLFCPKATVLVLNKGKVAPTRSWELAFGPIIESAIVKRVVERGGKLVAMPALGCMPEVVGKGIHRFSNAAGDEGRKKIGILNARRVRFWMEQEMPAMRRQIEEYLP